MNNFKDRNQNFYNGFYRAIVENNGADKQITGDDKVSDTQTRNRVQVRVLGVHSQNNTDSPEDGIPTANLPWAEQAAPLMGGFGPSGAGFSMLPEVGSWLWVFFENGNPNRPVYFASIMGNGERVNDGTGETVLVTKTGHRLTFTDELEENGGGGSVKIETNGGSSVIIQDKGIGAEKDEVIISSKEDVRVSAGGNIYFGNTGNYVVTSSKAGSITSYQGHKLTAEERIRS